MCILGSKTAVGFDSKLKNLCVATEDPSELLQRYNQKCTDTDRGQNSTWISCAVSISEVSTMYAPPSESCYKHATKHLCFQVNGVSLASHIEPFDVTSRYPISALKMGHDLQVVLYLQIWEDILPKIIMICCYHMGTVWAVVGIMTNARHWCDDPLECTETSYLSCVVCSFDSPGTLPWSRPRSYPIRTPHHESQQSDECTMR